MSFHSEMAVMLQTPPHVIGAGGAAIVLSIRSSAWKTREGIPLLVYILVQVWYEAGI